MLASASALVSHSVGDAGPAPQFIPQTFIDARHEAKNQEFKVNETYYLTSWGKRPIVEDLGSVADGREKDRVLWKPGGEHALGFEEAGRLPRGGDGRLVQDE